MLVLCVEFCSSTDGLFPPCYKVIILVYKVIMLSQRKFGNFRYGSEGHGIMSLELVHLLNFGEMQWMLLGLYDR